MQISNGTCSVENGSAIVVAAANVDWSDVPSALKYGITILFALTNGDPSVGDDVPRRVVASESPATSASGFWELTLVSPWTGSTIADAEYFIHKDFTPNAGLALAAGGGERGWSQLFNRNMTKLDANFPFNVGLIAGVETVLAGGRTLYASNTFDVPEDATLDIQEGATLEVG